MIHRFLLVLISLTFLGCVDQKEPATPPSNPKPLQTAMPANDLEETEDSQPESPVSETPTDNSSIEQELLAGGALGGQPFEVSSVELTEGILELRQGKDTFADNKLILFLFLDDDGVLPEDQTIEVKSESSEFGGPHIHARWKGPEDKFGQSEIFMMDYDLELKFGKESEKGKLPFTISLKLPDENKSYLKGEFVAEVNGFRIIDGKVDLTSDSFRTLEHVAKEFLSQSHDGNPVEMLNSRDGMFTHTEAEKQQWGRNDYEYKVGEEKNQRAKLIFNKGPEGWSVSKVLKSHQLFEAHPTAPADDSWRRGDHVQYVVAHHLEAEFASQEPLPVVHEVQLIAAYAPSSEYSTLRARYKIGEAEEPIKRAFVTKKTEDGYEIVQEIEYDAQIDSKTGEVKPDETAKTSTSKK